MSRPRSRTSIAPSLQAQIAKMEQDIKEMAQGSELDKAIARLDHFKVLDQHLQAPRCTERCDFAPR